MMTEPRTFEMKMTIKSKENNIHMRKVIKERQEKKEQKYVKRENGCEKIWHYKNT